MLFNSVFVNVDVTCFFKGPAIQVFQVLGAAYEMPFCPRLFCFFFFAADGLIWAGRPWWRWCFGRLVWMHHSYIGGSSFSSFGPFQAVEGGGGWLVGCVQDQELCARAHRLSRFTLLVSFRDTLLVVSISDLVYDCHLRPLLQS